MRIVKKTLADPGEVFFDLLLERDAGADTGMYEQSLPIIVHQGGSADKNSACCLSAALSGFPPES